jgi:hypothetical protein
MEIPFSQLLFSLKVSTISVSGIVIKSAADCLAMQQLITNKTGRYISLVALERIFGFAPNKFNPSPYTLDVLSKYCGYADWGNFCARHLNDWKLTDL